MNYPIDKRGVDQSFSRAAEQYERYAEHQRLTALLLAGRLPEYLTNACGDRRPVQRILELGCGTGLMTSLIVRHHPEAEVIAIDIAPGMIEFCRKVWVNQVSPEAAARVRFEVADAEHYQPDGPVDLIVANCTLQWFQDRPTCFAHLRGLLTPDGRLIMSVPVEGTLRELEASYLEATGQLLKGLDIWSERRYRTALQQAGCRVLPATIQEPVKLFHKDPLEVVRSLKGIGATFRDQPGFEPLTVRQMRRLIQAYRDKFSDPSGRVSATYEVLFIVAEPE